MVIIGSRRVIKEENSRWLQIKRFNPTKTAHIFFLFLNKNISCGYSMEAPRQGASNKYSQHVFLSTNKECIHLSVHITLT